MLIRIMDDFATIHARGICLHVAEMTDVKARDGRWHAGSSHQKEQTCVQDIDRDINVHVRVGAP